MDSLVEHLLLRWPAYVAIVVILLPFLYFGRRYTVPTILWSVELAIYMTILHLFLLGLLRSAAWFKVSTEMFEKTDPGWSIPAPYFWKTELYNPPWILYFEILVLIVLVGLILRYRPIKVQAPTPKRSSAIKGVGTQKTEFKGGTRK